MNQRERMLAGVTGAVVGVFGLVTWVIEPTVTKWRDLSEREDVLEQAVERDRAARARLPELVAARRALDATLEPDDGSGVVPWFIAHVRDKSQAAGIEPEGLRFAGAKPTLGADGKPTGGPFAELRFELTVRAPAQRLLSFLGQLAASPRPVRVSSLQLTPEKSGGKLECSLTLMALAPRAALSEEQLR